MARRRRKHRNAARPASSPCHASGHSELTVRNAEMDEVRAAASTVCLLQQMRESTPCFTAARRTLIALVFGRGPIRGPKVRATESTRDQLGATRRREIRSEATRSFRLGAGRSQVQILSPRLEAPANGVVCKAGATAFAGYKSDPEVQFFARFEPKRAGMVAVEDRRRNSTSQHADDDSLRFGSAVSIEGPGDRKGTHPRPAALTPRVPLPAQRGGTSTP